MFFSMYDDISVYHSLSHQNWTMGTEDNHERK